MAAEAPDFSIPASLNALDQDVYANNAGYPGHAALGRQLARNDRCLHANLRRTPVNQAFDIPNAPVVALLNGTLFGPFPAPGTPGVKKGEWYMRVVADANSEYWFVPWVEGLLPYDGLQGAAHEQEIEHVGAAGEVTFGPFETPLTDGWPPPDVGFVLHSQINLASTVTGAVAYHDAAKITSTLGSFVALSDPTRRVIRLLEPAPSITPITEYFDILRWGTRSVAGDSAMLYPFHVGWDSLDFRDNLQWEMATIYGVSVYCYMLRELPLSGSLVGG